ncbi:hypothetical protein BZZ01_15560 [Nostocales cyanobacterium HT-58-2]|nr:hypothetical protein BZZ01_15560 [Nostocales cyanobacterium HT-58-2]
MNQTETFPKLLIYCFIMLASTPVYAQITPDGTLGTEASRLTPNVFINGANADRIDGGAQRGGNLFHSFSQFNINDGQRVYFANPSGVQNIVSRVTGGQVSNILGTLGVDGNANLFLMNPNGILFGQNARLDVGGSFVGTTANAFRFGEQGLFSATNPETPPLLTIQPSALLFNQINNGAFIQNNSTASVGLDPTGSFNTVGLRVPDGRSLVLLGGEVSINSGGIVAFGGHIDIGGVKGTGSVGLNQNGDRFSLNFPSDLQRANVSLTDGAGFIVAGAGAGSSVTLTGDNISLSNNSSIEAGILDGLGAANTQAGDITLDATDVVNFASNSYISNYLDSGALGNSGNIIIKAKRLSLNQGSQIGTFNFGTGNTGNVVIAATDSVSLNGTSADGEFPSGIFANILSGAKGRGGNVSIQANSVAIKDGGLIRARTFGEGNAGRIEIQARDTVSLFGQGSSSIQNDVGLGGVGNSEGISINTDSLFLSDKAFITSNVDGRGNSGGVNIVARNLVSLDDSGELTRGGEPGTLILSRVNDRAVGNGGDINIKTDSLYASNSQITTSTFGEGNSGNVTIEAQDRVTLLRSTDIFTEVGCPCETESGIGGIGKGGDITIKTGSLLLDSGSNLRADTESRGKAGNIIVEARDSITFSGSSDEFTSGAFSEVEPEAVGQGGDIFITTGTLSLSGDQEINTRTQGQGDAGNIFIKANSISLAGPDVRIFSGASQEGRLPGTFGNGGDINITSGSLLVTDGAQVSATTEIRGLAGNITINASRLTLDNQGTIKSESVADADGGNIALNIREFLLMRHNSRISTNAGTAQQGGNGGNITINTPFIVSLPRENNDISANAFSGRGGNVNIRAQSIFGIQARPKPTGQSDITASSELGVQGQIDITQPEVQATQGLIELPYSVVDASNQIAQICPRSPNAKPLAEFIITGRGSLPPNPLEPMAGTPEFYRLATLDGELSTDTQMQERGETESFKTSKVVPAIVEAQGWVKTADGAIALVTYAPEATPSKLPTPSACVNHLQK